LETSKIVEKSKKTNWFKNFIVKKTEKQSYLLSPFSMKNFKNLEKPKIKILSLVMNLKLACVQTLNERFISRFKCGKELLSRSLSDSSASKNLKLD